MIMLQLVTAATGTPNLGKRYKSILSTRNVLWTFFWRPPPHPPLEMSRTF